MTDKFDALQYARKLEQAGVRRDQAAVHAEAFGHLTEVMAPAPALDKLANTIRQELGDIEDRLTIRFDMVRTALSAQIDMLRIQVNSRTDSLQMELKAENSSLRAELNVLKWAIGFLVTLNIGVLIKLFIP